MNNSDMKTEFRMNVRIVSLNDKGIPETKEAPVVGDLYLTPSRRDPEMYDQWIWSGDDGEWQNVGTLPSSDDEKAMRQQRVENVKSYFKKKKEQHITTKLREISKVEIENIKTEYYCRQEQFMLAELC